MSRSVSTVLFHGQNVTAVTVYSVPDDGRKGRPKHVVVVVNKHNTVRVASC